MSSNTNNLRAAILKAYDITDWFDPFHYDARVQLEADVLALLPERAEKYVRMNSDCLEGWKIAIDQTRRNLIGEQQHE